MSWISEALDAYEKLGESERAAVDAARDRVVRACERRCSLMHRRAREAEAKGDDRGREVFDQRAIEANVLAVEASVAIGGRGSFRNLDAIDAIRVEADAAWCRKYERGDLVWVYDSHGRAVRPNGEPVGSGKPGWVAGRFEFHVTNGGHVGDVSVYRDDGGGRLVVQPWCVAPRAQGDDR